MIKHKKIKILMKSSNRLAVWPHPAIDRNDRKEYAAWARGRVRGD